MKGKRGDKNGKKRKSANNDMQMVIFMMLMLVSAGLLAYNLYYPTNFNGYNLAVAAAIGLITILYYLQYRKQK